MSRHALVRLVSWAVAVAALTGCSRHVVVDPQTVASRNDPDWKVHATPPTTVVVVVPAAVPSQ